MNGLDLFSGIGGLSLALEPWVRTVAYCEQDRYAQGVLMSRMRDGLLERAPIWDDVRTLSADQFGSSIDCIFGGFPCQDISSAGRGVGMEQGSRSGLFFQITRLVEELRPTFVFLENVPAIRTRGLSRVLSELTALGYDCRWTVVSAADVGAPHLRKRWFLLARRADAHGDGCEILSQPDCQESKVKRESGRHADRLRDTVPDAERSERRIESGRGRGTQGESSTVTGDDGAEESLANAESVGRIARGTESKGFERELCAAGGRSSLADTMRERRTRTRSERSTEEIGTGTFGEFARSGWWSTEPDVGRVAYGIPSRVDRLRCLGNAVVPIQARVAFQRLAGIEDRMRLPDLDGNGREK